jgi:hypothetical protein
VRRAAVILCLLVLVPTWQACKQSDLHAKIAVALAATNVLVRADSNGPIALQASEADAIKRIVQRFTNATGVQVERETSSDVIGQFFMGDIVFVWSGSRLMLEDHHSKRYLFVRDPALGDMTQALFRAMGHPAKLLDRADWESVLSALTNTSGLDLAETNNWITQSPVQEFVGSTEKSGILQSNINLVALTNIDRAVSMLQYEPCVEVTEEEAQFLVGKALQREREYRLFLVRGVCQNRDVGHFNCFYHDDMLWVAFGAMGSRDYPREKQPIIILLKNKPRRVFVSSAVME